MLHLAACLAQVIQYLYRQRVAGGVVDSRRTEPAPFEQVLGAQPGGALVVVSVVLGARGVVDDAVVPARRHRAAHVHEVVEEAVA